jgi:hypothetical protein
MVYSISLIKSGIHIANVIYSFFAYNYLRLSITKWCKGVEHIVKQYAIHFPYSSGMFNITSQGAERVEYSAVPIVLFVYNGVRTL